MPPKYYFQIHITTPLNPYANHFIGTWALIQSIDILIDPTNPMDYVKIKLLQDKCPSG
jgi:hypothetical protein